MRRVILGRGCEMSITDGHGAHTSYGERLGNSYHLLGLAFWQAWWMCAMCTEVVLPRTGVYASVGDAALWVLMLTTLGYLMVVAISKRFTVLSSRRLSFWLAGGLAAAGSALLPISLSSMQGGFGFAVFLFAATAVSAGNALLLMMWGELWSSLATSRVGRHLYVSYAFAFVLFVIVWFLPQPLPPITVACFPAISTLILYRCKDEPRRSPSVVPVPREALPIGTIIIAILAVSIVYGVSQGVVNTFAPAGGDGNFMLHTMILAGACIGLLALGMTVSQSSMEPMRLYQPVIPAFAAGLLLLVILPSELAFVGAGLIIVGIYCLDMLMMLVSTDVAFRSRIPVAFSFGFVILMARTGTLVGTAIAQALLAYPGWSAILRDDVVLVGVMIIVAVGTLLFTQLDLRALYNTVGAPFEVVSLDEKCADVARICDLSSRESEVLVLLARGRNIPYICEELSIAQGTAKHHVSSIYRKIGVYDRQGLHDVIEHGGVGRGSV